MDQSNLKPNMEIAKMWYHTHMDKALSLYKSSKEESIPEDMLNIPSKWNGENWRWYIDTYRMDQLKKSLNK